MGQNASVADRPEVYDQFLALMKDFRAQQLTTPAVIARVAELFRPTACAVIILRGGGCMFSPDAKAQVIFFLTWPLKCFRTLLCVCHMLQFGRWFWENMKLG